MLRVVLAEMPPGARVAVRESLSHEDGLRVVADAALSGLDLLVSVRETAADLVILGVCDVDIPPVCTHLLAEFPHVKIFGVDPDGHCHSIFEMRPCARRVSSAASNRLGEAIVRIVGST